MNVTRAIGIDVFHQDAQNLSRKIIKFFLRGLSPKNGEPVIACIRQDPYLRLPGAPVGGGAEMGNGSPWRGLLVLMDSCVFSFPS